MACNENDPCDECLDAWIHGEGSIAAEPSAKWTTVRRADRNGLVEHVCACGTGHPNFYSVVRLHEYCVDAFEYQEDEEYHSLFTHHLMDCAEFTHGCCGCCSFYHFPGRELSDNEILERMKQFCFDFINGRIGIKDLYNWSIYTQHDLRINERLHAGVYAQIR